MKRFLMLALASLACVASANVAHSQDPVAVLSIAPLEDLLADVRHGIDVLFPDENSRPDLSMIDAFLAGLDQEKPLGGTVTLDEEGQAIAVAYVPVTDFKAVLETLAQNGLAAEDAGDGIQQIGPAFCLEKDGYVHIAASPAHLAKLGDPAAWIGKSEEDIEVTIYVERVPGVLKQMALGVVKAGMDKDLVLKADETESDLALRKGVIERLCQQFEQMLIEGQQISIALSIEQEAAQTVLQIKMLGKDGSPLATQIEALAETSTQLAGLVNPKAPFSLRMASKLDETAIANWTQLITDYRAAAKDKIAASEQVESDEERVLFQSLATEALDLAQGVIDGGEFDVASIVLPDADGHWFGMAGLRVPNGKKVEAFVQKIIKIGQNSEPTFPKVTWNAAEHAGTALHTIDLPILDEEDAAWRDAVLGAGAQCGLGFSEHFVWVAVGADPLERIKTAVEASGPDNARNVEVFNYTLSLGSYIRMLKPMFADAGALAEMETILAELPEADQIRIVYRAQAGAVTRIELDDGLVRGMYLTALLQIAKIRERTLKELEQAPGEAAPQE